MKAAKTIAQNTEAGSGSILCNTTNTRAAPPPTITPTRGKKAAALPMSVSELFESSRDG
jgi:hypothetical protein